MNINMKLDNSEYQVNGYIFTFNKEQGKNNDINTNGNEPQFLIPNLHKILKRKQWRSEGGTPFLLLEKKCYYFISEKNYYSVSVKEHVPYEQRDSKKEYCLADNQFTFCYTYYDHALKKAY